jgi:pimeloyl-ACP methyl ester carboxylesterase
MRKPSTAAELLAELQETGRVELLGYALYQRLHDTIVGLSLREQVNPRTDRALLIRSLTVDGARPSDALAGELSERGPMVSTATVGVAEGWWFHRTQQSDHASVAGDLAGSISPWLSRSGSPVAVVPPASHSLRTCEFIATGGSSVFALLTPPTDDVRGEVVLLLWGGGGMPAFGRNQVASALARRLARRGYHVLQLDYPGRGDSPGSEPPDPIDEPAKQEVFAATRSAYESLDSRGLSEVVAVGTCQGAVAALATLDAAPALRALALLAPPIAERFEDPNGDRPCGGVDVLHPRMRESFRAVVRSRMPLLLAYGAHDEGFASFNAALGGELGAILAPAGDRVTLTVTDERIHGFMTLSGQQATIDIALGWLERIDR